MSNDRSNALVALLAGLAAGAALGILFAPASGKETRENIRRKGREYGEGLHDLVKEGMDQWAETTGRVKDKAQMTADDVTDFLTFLMDEGRDLKDRLEKEMNARKTSRS
jgi:gas vesicle protein